MRWPASQWQIVWFPRQKNAVDNDLYIQFRRRLLPGRDRPSPLSVACRICTPAEYVKIHYSPYFSTPAHYPYPYSGRRSTSCTTPMPARPQSAFPLSLSDWLALPPHDFRARKTLLIMSFRPTNQYAVAFECDTLLWKSFLICSKTFRNIVLSPYQRRAMFEMRRANMIPTCCDATAIVVTVKQIKHSVFPTRVNQVAIETTVCS